MQITPSEEAKRISQVVAYFIEISPERIEAALQFDISPEVAKAIDAARKTFHPQDARSKTA